MKKKIYKVFYAREQIGADYYSSEEEVKFFIYHWIQDFQFAHGIFNSIDHIKNKLDYFMFIYNLEIDKIEIEV